MNEDFELETLELSAEEEEALLAALAEIDREDAVRDAIREVTHSESDSVLLAPSPQDHYRAVAQALVCGRGSGARRQASLPARANPPFSEHRRLEATLSSDLARARILAQEERARRRR